MSLIGSFRFAWRLQRWEIAFVAIVCLTLAAFATWLTLDMRSILALCGTPAAIKACDVTYAFQDTHGSAVQTVQMVAGFVPFIVGLVLGVPVVSRELEQRTAQIAWPMSGSRLRWLAWRFGPMVVIGLAMVALPAIAMDQMQRAYFPRSDIGFYLYELRGVPMAIRTAFMLLAGVALGAIVGRLLPALLLGIAAGIALTVGLGLALPHWVGSTELGDAEVVEGIGDVRTDLQYRLADGRVVGAEEGEALVETAYENAGDQEPDSASLPHPIFYGIAASRYSEVVLRETAALVLACAALVGLTAVVVQRRRPE